MKILITGGDGTIGRAFISLYYKNYDFMVIGRDEQKMFSLGQEFPNVETRFCSIENIMEVYKIYDIFRPDAVLHLAAMKHVDKVEKQPIEGIKINVLGSLNIIQTSFKFRTKYTISVSTDKACLPSSIYGMSKYMMERMFLEANTQDIRFAVTRFGNVANSSGSVILLWKDLALKNMPLPITNINMNRMFFTKREAAELLKTALDMCAFEGGFILTKKMKYANMLDLAKVVSKDVRIIGSRPGESTEAYLISEGELPYTYVFDNDYIMIKEEENKGKNKLDMSISTLNAKRMVRREIKKLLEEN
jgi:UDP-glucose 4-epimerase